MQHVTKPRRKFISGAAVAGAAALGFPAVGRAQNAPISLRFQSTWPANDIFHEFARDYAQKVNDMAGGQLKIEVLPAGAVVKAFDLLDAVSAGTLDGGHGVVAYWYGKNTAVALWGSGPSFGMDANMLLAWHEYGGGKELLTEIQKAMGVNVVSLMYGPMPTQPFGWFKRPITKMDEVKGLKFRTVGLAIDMYTAMGAAVNALPGGEIVPALDRGLLDGAEFNNASSDLALGFQDVSKICMLQSFHQSAEQFEVLFNKGKYDALPEHLKHILSYAAQACSADMSWKAANRYSQDYVKLQKDHNVKFYKTPDAILQQQLKIWDEMIAKRSAENPLFKKVLDSQRAFAERVGRWHGDTSVNFRMAYNHYFSRSNKA
ncbi:TRAP transporter substrate-binding protein [Achromobacter denitrificans]|uniref:TRAP transporter substrate-binding protein n=1 Tax=Achromobacter denitrificans TaxID=32002 RepID=A0ABZ3GBH2_ACHDE|nr:TRAP transporter substrate-binding protein [Achromobacter denitrificans]MBV2159033.1 TRAP transporter substrate-binding protein [Achromobacter denitrificans]MDF3850214.1 TRAP transporter substrate-binding protein [Achromobacter denitrificans]MDF3862222.1 TRAP transporter substrate-binding protein [Achromobacter denitrificans]MDF3941769.1 TRAP transporter substrate-binding protein [Achromobacter denitrificans]OLU01742.1 C4-dicarboxylate ABC transporter [Achromobacter denitrificans]